MNDRPSPERLTFFSDAVIAIAMTLLALELVVPEGDSDRALWHDFGARWGTEYFPFLLSFVVIAAFWHSHHQLFRRIKSVGPGIVPLNFGFLLMIVATPFVTRVLGADGEFQIGPVLYAAVVALTAAFITAMAWRAVKLGDVREGQGGETHDLGRSLLGTAVMFTVSIPVGLARPALAPWSWLVLGVGAKVGADIWQRTRHRPPPTPDGLSADDGPPQNGPHD